MPAPDPAAAQVNLCPPKEVISLAHQVMGQIDLDGWASPISGPITQASRGHDHTQLSVDEICRMDWDAGTGGRALLAVPSGTANARRLANKALRELRAGRIQEAVLWLGANEALISLPWIWDQLVCVPFRRLRPLALEVDLGEYYTVSPGSWSVIAYLPPAEPFELRMQRIARFRVCAAPIGRLIQDGDGGDSDWAEAYASSFSRPYSYHH